MVPRFASPSRPRGKTVTRELLRSGGATQGGGRDCGVPQVSATESGFRGDQRKDLPSASHPGGEHRAGAGEKTAEAIQREVAQEVESLLAVIFAGRRKAGKLDLEAVQMATRAALHRAGAAGIEELLAAQGECPSQVPCGCGQQAHYQERRSKPWVTVLGRVETERPYDVCAACHRGQSRRDRELDVEGTEYSPGVRRMRAVGGSETSLAQGREQLALLAGLEVTTKAVERQAEALGAQIAAQEQATIQISS